MNNEASTDLRQRLSALRMIVLAMAGALVMIGAVLQIVLAPQPFEITQLAVTVGLGLLGGVVALLLAGTLIQPVERADPDPVATGMNRLQSATMLQLALTEGTGLLLVVLAFVMDLNPLAVLLGTLVAAAMVLVVAWPGQGRLRKVRQLLERDGARCPLDEQHAR